MFTYLPKRPCGRIPSINNSKPNATAVAQDAPKSVSTIDSATPNTKPATNVPLMLPMPANTTTQNVRPM
jgi:hypothetical protein